nr:hypothetical protein CoNPh37_CDS0078 [Staphylococcus phage S-CoN_Ph37]
MFYFFSFFLFSSWFFCFSFSRIISSFFSSLYFGLMNHIKLVIMTASSCFFPTSTTLCWSTSPSTT